MDGVNYLLLFKSNSSHGGHESSVRGFMRQEAAQTAMIDSYKKYAAALNIPISSEGICDQYTTKTKNSIRLERFGDVFQWEVLKAVPEDGGAKKTSLGTESEQSCRMTGYTVIIKEHIAREFSTRAYSFFSAMDSAAAAYKQGALSANRSRLCGRMMMARNDETGEETEWKEF